MGIYINRKEESDRIDQIFSDVRDNRRARAVWLTGQRGVGKSALVDQFLLSINKDDIFKHHHGILKPHRDVVRSKCVPATDQEKIARFSAFSKIGERIKNRKWYFSVFVKLIEIFISLLSVGDLKDKISKFVTTISPEDPMYAQLKEHIKEFKSYARECRRASKKRPLIIVVEDAEYMDKQSATLLQFVLKESGAFHGLIILDQGEREIVDGEVKKKLKELVDEKCLQKLHLKPFNRVMTQQFLDNRFNQKLFDADQIERIQEKTNGLPGKLNDCLNKWISDGEIVSSDGGWTLPKAFTSRLLFSDDDKYLAQVRFYLKDDNLDEREISNLRTMADAFKLKCDPNELRKLGYLERRTGLRIVYHLCNTSVGNAYRAVDLSTNRDVLLQTIYDMPIRSDDVRAVLDARSNVILAARRIETEEEMTILVSDYFQGKTLQQIQKDEGERTLLSTLEIAKSIAKALEDAEGKGVIHGFLMPENIIVSDSGDLRVTGFGLIVSDWHKEKSDLKADLVQIYVPPEVRAGSQPDSRSNVYSLGVILYEMIAGITSIERQTYAERFAGQPLKVAPDEVQKVLNRALDRDPVSRFRNGREFVEALDIAITRVDEDEIKKRQEVDQRRRGEAERGRKLRRIRAVSIAAGSCLVAVLAGALLFKNMLLAPNVNDRSIFIQGFKIQGDIPNISKGMLEYAIQRHLLRFSESTRGSYKPLLDSSAFRHLRRREGDTTASANFEIEGSLERKGSNLVVEVLLRDIKQGKSDKKTFQLQGERDLLDHGVDNVVDWILPFLGLPEDEIKSRPKTAAIFTAKWNAFEYFYSGDRRWARLENKVAMQDLNRAISIDSGFGLAYLRLAEIRAFQSDPDLGTTLAQALAHKSSLIAIDTIKLHALISAREGRVSDQQDDLAKLSEILPWDPKSYYDLAESYFHVVELRQAIQSYEQATKLRRHYALAHNHLGYSYSYQGDNEKALAAFRQYVSIDSSSNSYDSYGDGLMFAGQYKLAVDAKMRGIQLGENYYGALSNIYWLSGRLDSARNAATEMIAHATRPTDSVQGHFRLAFLNYFKGKYPQAKAECNTFIKGYAPTRWIDRVLELEWLKGLIAYELNDQPGLKTQVDSFKVAVDRQAITWEKYRPVLKFYTDLKYRLELLQGREQEALTTMSEFEQNKEKLRYWSSPFDFSYLLTEQSRILISKLRRPAEARAVLQKAIAYNNSFAMAHYRLGLLLDGQGQKDEAKEEFRKFLDIWSAADASLPEFKTAQSRVTSAN